MIYNNLVLDSVHPSEVEELLDYLSPEGLFIASSCKTEEDAMELLKIVEKR